ncbi:hypothetical protein LCGC14_0363060 [marine sediment metagenome]|uniref:Uncharacterized protein n=1 Tax=marine sediment metagenome TaxID=412755 RepID=A0A0F9T7B8_9ZZZZ
MARKKIRSSRETPLMESYNTPPYKTSGHNTPLIPNIGKNKEPLIPKMGPS